MLLAHLHVGDQACPSPRGQLKPSVTSCEHDKHVAARGAMYPLGVCLETEGPDCNRVQLSPVSLQSGRAGSCWARVWEPACTRIATYGIEHGAVFATASGSKETSFLPAWHGSGVFFVRL